MSLVRSFEDVFFVTSRTLLYIMLRMSAWVHPDRILHIAPFKYNRSLNKRCTSSEVWSTSLRMLRKGILNGDTILISRKIFFYTQSLLILKIFYILISIILIFWLSVCVNILCTVRICRTLKIWNFANQTFTLSTDLFGNNWIFLDDWNSTVYFPNELMEKWWIYRYGII